VGDFQALFEYICGGYQSWTEALLHQRGNCGAVQYPEEKLPVPEEFRYIPFLVYEEGENGEKNQRCTSCGICAKVCPPQCIWIVRTSDPVTGKPVPSPAEFNIDVDICMNCGLCAEYCPFDAIKMDHNYEIASYNRLKDNIYDLQKLSRPLSYYASIRPANYTREEAARLAEREAKAAKKSAAASPKDPA
jgi:NADH-quinone oxidoreductase subunit I